MCGGVEARRRFGVGQDGDDGICLFRAGAYAQSPQFGPYPGGGRAVAQLRLWPPALSVPAGRAKNGLPWGLQCVAGWQRDEELLGWSRALAEVFS